MSEHTKLPDIVERLRERRKLKYIGNCKCGRCQLVHIDDVYEAADEIERLRSFEEASKEGGEIIIELKQELERLRSPAPAADMEARKDAAYLERNQVVAALASVFPSGTARTAIPGWSDDWHGCVYIDLPTGQASWHYHDSHAHLFARLPPYAGQWDGHTTDEKYARLAALPSAPAEDGEGLREAVKELLLVIDAEVSIGPGEYISRALDKVRTALSRGRAV